MKLESEKDIWVPSRNFVRAKKPIVQYLELFLYEIVPLVQYFLL